MDTASILKEQIKKVVELTTATNDKQLMKFLKQHLRKQITS